jgi:hypothetical protein
VSNANIALKVATECVVSNPGMVVMNGMTFWMVVLEETAPLGRHFQGGLRTCAPRAKALGYSVRPFHGQNLAAAHQPPITEHYISQFTEPGVRLYD